MSPAMLANSWGINMLSSHPWWNWSSCLCCPVHQPFACSRVLSAQPMSTWVQEATDIMMPPALLWKTCRQSPTSCLDITHPNFCTVSPWWLREFFHEAHCSLSLTYLGYPQILTFVVIQDVAQAGARGQDTELLDHITLLFKLFTLPQL